MSASNFANSNPDLSEQNRHSFDSSHNSVVSLNAISKAKGIKGSLLSSAKGGISVGIEEPVHGGGLLQFFLERNSEEIESELASLYLKYFSLLTRTTLVATARKNVLLQNEDFIHKVSERTHFTALFILQDIEVEGDERDSIR
ncbi:MAG: hypothetical protein SNF33_02825 [Candidatus Algichlamydia australiensis]|nr:hypothetical protein [Chlamydiales bacterium]